MRLAITSFINYLAKATLYTIFGFTAVYAQKTPDSITVAAGPDYNNVGQLHRFFFGNSYRQAWATPVKVRVVKLSEEKGGLKILQLGGGMQTKSLRLQDGEGKQWVLRTLQKFPERNMAENLKNTVAKDILQDQVSTTNPFASLTVPTLAAALGITHAKPEIIYLADDVNLGEHRSDFANQLFLFEERMPGETDKTQNTEKVFSALRKDNDAKVDQKSVLRARLLDMLLSDWDRHEDQWRWEKTKVGQNDIYKPVPRDRDQVFYKTSGVFPWIVAHQWLKSKFQPFKDEIRDINGWNFNARYFDRSFLNELNEQDWINEIETIQQLLTDDVIAKAIKKLPAPIWEIDGKYITQTLINRRDNLKKQALTYYKFIATTVEIPTSDKHEQFNLTYQEDGSIALKVYKTLKTGEIQQAIYQRVFYPGVTKEIRLYGFNGNDNFKISGAAKSPINVRLIGGDDKDTFTINDDFSNKSKLYIYDRKDQNNNLPNQKLAKLRLSTDTSVNSYNRLSFVYDRFAPIFSAEYNNDSGIAGIVGFSNMKQGFRKEPYAFYHQFLVKYSTGRESFQINYFADWKKAIANNDLQITLDSYGPNNMSNFFGIGNETYFNDDDDDNIWYYRNRYDYVNADISLGRTINHINFKLGLAGQMYNSGFRKNEYKFLNEYQIDNPQQAIFDTKWYGGFVFSANSDKRNSTLKTTKGYQWDVNFRTLQNLNTSNKRFAELNTSFGFYLSPNENSNVVLANRTGFGTTIGKAEFFQMARLGGPQNLRGFRTGRFTGETKLYNNLELRWDAINFKSYLFPATIGLLGFYDTGRVWVKNESSRQWHNGYGGGIYFSPADLFLIQYVIGLSKESTLSYLNIGFRF